MNYTGIRRKAIFVRGLLEGYLDNCAFIHMLLEGDADGPLGLFGIEDEIGPHDKSVRSPPQRKKSVKSLNVQCNCGEKSRGCTYLVTPGSVDPVRSLSSQSASFTISW